MPWLKPQWRDWHKLWSMRIVILWTAFSNLWVLSAAVQDYVSPAMYFGFSMLALLGIILARIFNQSSTDL